MRIKRIMAAVLSIIAMSCLITACKKAAGTGTTDAVSDVSPEEDVINDIAVTQPNLNDYDPSAALDGMQKYDEQKAKYGKMLPADYTDMPKEMTYGIMTDINGFMVSHMIYFNNGEKEVYTDSEGRKTVDIDHLDMRDAEIVFEDGSAASADDLSPGTAVLVEYDLINETYPGDMHCTKIVIPK